MALIPVCRQSGIEHQYSTSVCMWGVLWRYQSCNQDACGPHIHGNAELLQRKANAKANHLEYIVAEACVFG